MLRRVALLLAVVVLALAGATSSLLASGTTAPVITMSSTTTTPVAVSTTTTPLTTTTTTPVPPAASTSSNAPTTIVLTGHGWGHGIGMSQWGAYGYALHGWTADQILTHYYTGTTVGLDPPELLRVLLLEGKVRVTLDSAADWTVVDANGTTVSIPAGKLVLDKTLAVEGQTLVPPLTFSAGTAPLEVGSSPYRGQLVVSLVDSKLQVVNRVGIEDYVMGVVPSEVPSTWPAQALEAQAVAARSYALASLTTIVTASNYDLFSDSRSQVYGGIAAETPATNAAVAATAHQIVLYDGKVATTYFSSSSGGRTVSAAEAMGTPVPYLVSVSDPYDTYSPNHDWGPVVFDAAAVAKAVGLQGPLLGLQTTVGPSKHVTKATAIGTSSQVVLTGPQIRADLGLRSSWFSVGWLSLTPVPALTYGSSVSLSGVVRGVAGVTLDEKPAGGAWQTVETVTPDATGAFTVPVRPQATTSYRLTSGVLHGALIKVAVVPTVVAQAGVGGVEGTIEPVLQGSTLELQLHGPTGWTTVATGSADASGTFALVLPPAPAAGSYRVRCAPGHGLSPGVSALLTIS